VLVVKEAERIDVDAEPIRPLELTVVPADVLDPPTWPPASSVALSTSPPQPMANAETNTAMEARPRAAAR